MSTLIDNKRAGFEYEILDRYEAGIELLGFEVKALRNKRGSLENAFVSIRGGEAFLLGSDIPPYQIKNAPKDYDSLRARRLLLTKKEIKELIGKEKMRGLTIVPLSLYNKGRKIKVSLAVARGKRKYEKREKIKRREAEREIRRTLKYE
jgi:SsrA-binding protein